MCIRDSCCCVGVMLASVAAVVFASYLARLSGTDADMPDLYVLKMAENSIVYAADPSRSVWGNCSSGVQTRSFSPVKTAYSVQSPPAGSAAYTMEF